MVNSLTLFEEANNAFEFWWSSQDFSQNLKEMFRIPFIIGYAGDLNGL